MENKPFELFRELHSVGFSTFVQCFELLQARYAIADRHQLGEQMLLYMAEQGYSNKGKPYVREASHAIRIFEAGLEIHALKICLERPRLQAFIKEQATQYYALHAPNLNVVEENVINLMEPVDFQVKVDQPIHSEGFNQANLFPIQRPEKLEAGVVSKWRRNPRVAREVMYFNNYSCQISAEHPTFISNRTGKPYVEAHHLIPVEIQSQFEYSLDVHSNIVALCPNCHRLVHYAEPKVRNQHVATLFEGQQEQLRKQNLEISINALFRYYA
jgi:hypothetical protein